MVLAARSPPGAFGRRSSRGTGSISRTSVPFASNVTASRSASRPTSREHIAVADRYFTPAEANELLPTVRPLAERMAAHRRALAVATVRHARIATKIAGNGGGVRPHEVDELQAAIDEEAAEIVRCVAELQERGVLGKDLDQGPVDFPALRGGEEVLLCWRLGEDEVGFWHSLEDGFAGRKPLP